MHYCYKILLKSDVVCLSYENVYSCSLFSGHNVYNMHVARLRRLGRQKFRIIKNEGTKNAAGEASRSCFVTFWGTLSQMNSTKICQINLLGGQEGSLGQLPPCRFLDTCLLHNTMIMMMITWFLDFTMVTDNSIH